LVLLLLRLRPQLRLLQPPTLLWPALQIQTELPPDPLQMRDGDELMAVPESTDRLQQARELGPLFTSVFGSAATAGLAELPELL
jgi:hypothetical protein